MNSFAHTLGQGTARVIDGTQDAVEATWDNSKIAATAFGKGYREQHARNLMRREQRRAVRELRIKLHSHGVVSVYPARSTS